MSQISQDSADADAPASSIDSTSVLENEPVAKVNEPVAKVNVPPTYFSNRHSHKYHHSILKFQKILVKGLKIYNSSNGTFFHGLYQCSYKIPNHKHLNVSIHSGCFPNGPLLQGTEKYKSLKCHRNSQEKKIESTVHIQEKARGCLDFVVV